MEWEDTPVPYQDKVRNHVSQAHSAQTPIAGDHIHSDTL